MKKSFSISVVLLFIFAITFTSCQKQNLQQNPVNEQTTLTKVLNFKQLVENPTKSNDLMTIDSAVWYIEALLNYNYCIVEDSTQIYSEVKYDSTFLSVNSTNGTIETNKVVDAYFDIEEQILYGLKNVNASKKRINIVDVEFKDEQFSAYYGFNYNLGDKFTYYIFGDWHWGMDENGTHQGMCDWTYVFEKDAGTEINRAIRPAISYLYNVFFTNVDFWQIGSHDLGNPYWYLFERFDNPYRIWREPGITGVMNYSDFWFGYADMYQAPYYPCIDEVELNWYKNAAVHAISQIKKYVIPSDKDFKDYVFIGWKNPSTASVGKTYYLHQVKVFYGDAHNIMPEQ